MARVKTEFSGVVDLIPDNECINSPLVEVVFRAFGESAIGSQPAKCCTLNIPVCKTKESLSQNIQVRHFDSKLHSESECFTRVHHSESQQQNKVFSMEKHLVQVHTRNFSQFVCTICNESCDETICSEFLRAFVYAKLNCLESKTNVDIKAFLCSYLLQLEAFEKVIFPEY